MTEEHRRKEFIKAAHDVMEEWPDYAVHKFPTPTNRTDQCLQCNLRFTQELLILIWKDCRAGRATHEDFLLQLTSWRIERMHYAEIFDIGKSKREEDSVDKKMKQIIKERREKCKFRN